MHNKTHVGVPNTSVLKSSSSRGVPLPCGGCDWSTKCLNRWEVSKQSSVNVRIEVFPPNTGRSGVLLPVPVSSFNVADRCVMKVQLD